MAIPSSRENLIDYCKRRLGFPVIEINVDDDQVEDRIDDALQFFQDYHYDAIQKIYLKHRVSQTDIDRQYIDMTQASGVATVTSGSASVSGSGTNFAAEFSAGVTQLTINGETKLVSSINGTNSMTMNSAFSANASSVPISIVGASDLITGVTRIFSLSSTNATVNMFDLRYQLRLHELYDFTSTSYVNFVLTQQHLRTLDMLFSGEQPIRFNRHQNRLYIDFQWGTDIQSGEYLVIEAYRIIDPDSYTNVYNDRWLKRYSTALIKRQWGLNLKKFGGIQLPGGVQLNGQQIYDEAESEIATLEQEMQDKYEVPPEFILG
jgi:hypothetical protein